MIYEEQLQRMTDVGTITPAQAERLKKSLTKSPVENKPLERKNFPWFIFVMAVLFIAMLAFLIAGNGDVNSINEIQNVSKTLNQTGGIGTMNSTMTKIISIAVLLIVPVIAFVWLHNSIISKEEEVHKSWAQVESNYQRRADLIPNLIATVSKYMEYEAETLTAITDERNGDVDDKIEELIEAQEKGSKLLEQAEGKAPESTEYLKNWMKLSSKSEPQWEDL